MKRQIMFFILLKIFFLEKSFKQIRVSVLFEHDISNLNTTLVHAFNLIIYAPHCDFLIAKDERVMSF